MWTYIYSKFSTYIKSAFYTSGLKCIKTAEHTNYSYTMLKMGALTEATFLHLQGTWSSLFTFIGLCNDALWSAQVLWCLMTGLSWIMNWEGLDLFKIISQFS